MWGSVDFKGFFLPFYDFERPNRSSTRINFLNISTNQLLNQYVKLNLDSNLFHLLFTLIFKNTSLLVCELMVQIF